MEEILGKWSEGYLRTVAATANTCGGTLCFSTDEDFREIGKLISERLGIEVQTVPGYDGGYRTVEIHVGQSHWPVTVDGKVPVISNGRIHDLSGKELGEYILGRRSVTWGSMPSPVYSEDVDTYAFRRFLRDAGIGNKDVVTILREHGLWKDGRPTNAAMVMFSERTDLFPEGATVKIGFRRGCDIVYSDEVRGPMYTVFGNVCDLLRTKYNLSDGIPWDAVKEAFTNAVVHNDYTDPSGITVTVQEDVVTVTNACGQEWDCSDRVPRTINPGIAGIFRTAKLMTGFGRGMDAICSEYDGSSDIPRFSCRNGMFTVTVPSTVRA